MRFRDDVNGLRALAVLAVVVFHFNSTLLPAGFAGVDVFFVISGYLMTGAIYPKVQSGTFSLPGFYVSRARRLIPALLVLCAAMLVWGYFNLLPVDYKQLGTHAAGALTFTSNLMFYSESGYFDSASHLKWLLHTWSLSVEWQFYLLYPLLIMALLKTVGARLGRLAIVALMCLSFALATWLSYRAESFAYFMLPSRAWEMLIGGVVYLYPLELRGRNKAWVALTGLGLIILSLVVLDSTTPWPGQWALLPVAGTCLVFVAAYTGTWLTTNGLVAWLGKTSYSTYLWHWPVCVYLYKHGLSDQPWAIAGGIALSFALGSASYWTVERPGTRRASAVGTLGRWRSRTRRPLAISTFVLVAVSGYTIAKSNGAPYRIADEIKALSSITNVYEYFDFKQNIRYGVCHSVPKDASFAQCIEPGRKMIFIWGDSYAAALYQGVLKVRDDGYPEYGIAQMTDGNGPPFFAVSGKTDEGKPVVEANNDRLAAVAMYKPDVVLVSWLVFGSNAPHEQNQALALLGDTVAKITAASPSTKVVVIGPVPHWNGNLNSKVLDYWTQYKQLPPEYMEYGLNPQVMAWDSFFKARVPAIGASYISALDVFCKAQACLSRLGDDVTDLPVVDFGHLSKHGSVYLMDKIKADVFN